MKRVLSLIIVLVLASGGMGMAQTASDNTSAPASIAPAASMESTGQMGEVPAGKPFGRVDRQGMGRGRRIAAQTADSTESQEGNFRKDCPNQGRGRGFGDGTQPRPKDGSGFGARAGKRQGKMAAGNGQGAGGRMGKGRGKRNGNGQNQRRRDGSCGRSQ